MAKLRFTKLDHPTVKTFSCGNPSIDKMIEASYFLTLLDRCHAYEVTYNHTVVAYYQIQFKRFPIQRFPEPIDAYSLNQYEDLYALHIEYLAVNQKYQHKGIGTAVLRYLLTQIRAAHLRWPFRLVTINALESKAVWYESLFGFQEVGQDLDDPETILMMIDLISPENAKILNEMSVE